MDGVSHQMPQRVLEPQMAASVARDHKPKKRPTRRNPLKDSTASAYSLTRHPAEAGLRVIQSSENAPRTKTKKADVAKPRKDFAASAYSLSRPPVSTELRFMKSSEIV